MSSTPPDPRQLAPLEQTIFDVETALLVTTQAIDRLFDAAFEDGRVARRRFEHLRKTMGEDTALAILQGRHAWIDRSALGFRKGSLLSPGRLKEANRAITELNERLPEQMSLVHRLGDLRRTHRAMLEEADRQRLRTNEPETTRPHDRGRGRR